MTATALWNLEHLDVKGCTIRKAKLHLKDTVATTRFGLADILYKSCACGGVNHGYTGKQHFDKKKA